MFILDELREPGSGKAKPTLTMETLQNLHFGRTMKLAWVMLQQHLEANYVEKNFSECELNVSYNGLYNSLHSAEDRVLPS